MYQSSRINDKKMLFLELKKKNIVSMSFSCSCTHGRVRVYMDASLLDINLLLHDI